MTDEVARQCIAAGIMLAAKNYGVERTREIVMEIAHSPEAWETIAVLSSDELIAAVTSDIDVACSLRKEPPRGQG